jgi:hypothetical protein
MAPALILQQSAENVPAIRFICCRPWLEVSAAEPGLTPA